MAGEGNSFPVYLSAFTCTFMINIIVSKIEVEARLELNGSRLPIPSLPKGLLAIGSGLKPGDTLVVDYAHAELILLRVMKRVRGGELLAADVNIMLKEQAELEAIHMPLNERGGLVKGWPGGFFESSLDEMF